MELEDEPDIRARTANPSQVRQTARFGESDRTEQRSPGKEDRQPMCERGELSRGVFEREPAVERIRRSAPGGVAQVVRDRVDADEQDARLVLRRAADERSIAGTKVDVDRLEGAGQLVESSTVYAALFPAFNDVH